MRWFIIGRMIKRPRWLIALMLVLALVQAGNAIRALQLPAVTSLIPPLEVLSGVFWAVLLSVMAVVLWRNPDSRAIRRSLVLLLVFSTYFVARLTIFARADYDRQRLPFVWLVASVVIVIIVWLRRKQWQ